MLWPLSWDDDNWRGMFHTLEMNYHALTVVMSRWQLTEHVSYLRYISPCSDRCQETMTTDGACFIPKGWLTMLLPLLWDDDNWRSRFHTLGMYNHALSVVISRWQLTEHVSYLMNTSSCSDPCYETMTTDGAWFITLGMNSHAQTVVIRPWQLTELFHTWGIYYHALTVVMGRWQLTEHGAYLRSE